MSEQIMWCIKVWDSKRGRWFYWIWAWALRGTRKEAIEYYNEIYPFKSYKKERRAGRVKAVRVRVVVEECEE